MLNISRILGRFAPVAKTIQNNLKNEGILLAPLASTLQTEQRRTAAKWYPDKQYFKEFEEVVYLTPPHPMDPKDLPHTYVVRQEAPQHHYRHIILNFGPQHPAAHGV